MWNINEHRYRTSSVLEGLNCKLNSFIRKRQIDVFLQAQKLQEEAELVTCQLKSKKLDSLVKNEERMK
jgi:hypothetical protein